MSFMLSPLELQEITGGHLAADRLTTDESKTRREIRVVTEIRTVRPGDIFWSLIGATANHGDLADQAFAKGAQGVVTSFSHAQPGPGRFVLQVPDPLAALWQLAQWRRAKFGGTVIGVTGSVGKTTTRQMLDCVLGSRFSGYASPHNYNNHVGLPLSLLEIGEQATYAVLEMGASQLGEIGELTRLAKPRIGVVTRVGEGELPGFGTLKGLADAKGELLAALPTDGLAIINGDDQLLARLASRSAARVVRVGKTTHCDVLATAVSSFAGQLRFQVEKQAFQVPIWGRHQLTSALCAVAVGRAFGLSLEAIAHALRHLQQPPMRSEVMQFGGITIINDTYNANPMAMEAALNLLFEVDAPGRRIAVCGDMRELGTTTGRLHFELGRKMVTVCGADLLIACGQHAATVVAGAQSAGMPARNTVQRTDAQEAVEPLLQSVREGDVVLLKGSRSMRMERILVPLKQRLEGHALAPHVQLIRRPSPAVAVMN